MPLFSPSITTLKPSLQICPTAVTRKHINLDIDTDQIFLPMLPFGSNLEEAERVELLDDSLRNKLLSIKAQRTTAKRWSTKGSSTQPTTAPPVSLKDQLLREALQNQSVTQTQPQTTENSIPMSDQLPPSIPAQSTQPSSSSSSPSDNVAQNEIALPASFPSTTSQPSALTQDTHDPTQPSLNTTAQALPTDSPHQLPATTTSTLPPSTRLPSTYSIVSPPLNTTAANGYGVKDPNDLDTTQDSTEFNESFTNSIITTFNDSFDSDFTSFPDSLQSTTADQQYRLDFDPTYEQAYDPVIATIIIDESDADQNDSDSDSDVVVDEQMTASSFDAIRANPKVLSQYHSAFRHNNFPTASSHQSNTSQQSRSTMRDLNEHLSLEFIHKNSAIWQEEDLHSVNYDINSVVTLSDEPYTSTRAPPSLTSLDMDTSFNTNTLTTANFDRASLSSTASSESDSNEFISLKEQINFVAIEKDAKSGLINPSTMHKFLPTFLPPWIRPNPIDLYHYYHAPVFQRLHNEIVLFVEYMKPTAEEKHARTNLIQKLQRITSKLFPSSFLDVFGSSSTQTQLPFGDVDLVLFVEPRGHEKRQLEYRQRLIDEQTREINQMSARGQSGMRPRTQVPECEFSRNAFSILALYLQKKNVISDVELITRARVPVMKFIDVETGLHVDITLNSYSGTEAAAFMQEQMEHFPQLQHLTLVIKYFLFIRGLNEAFTGGIGSFVIQTMLIAMLQRHPARFTAQQVTLTPSDSDNPFSVEELQNEAGLYGIFSNDLERDKKSTKQPNSSKKQPKAPGPKILNRITSASRPIIIPHINTTVMNLGVLLFSFFRMYCFEVNYPLIKIDISGSGLIAKKTLRASTNTGGVPFLMLLNPLDVTHDMTANSYNLHNVRAAFLHGYHVMLNHLICADPDNSASYLSSIPTSPLLTDQSSSSSQPHIQHISHPHHVMQLYRAELSIRSTLLSELLPVCPDLVDIRPNQVVIPLSYIQPRQIHQFDQYCLETFGSTAQEYLESTAGAKRSTIVVPTISAEKIVQYQEDDFKRMAQLKTNSPSEISLDPVDIYLLMQKSYNAEVLQRNEQIYLQATDNLASIDAFDDADLDPNTGEPISRSKKSKKERELERVVESTQNSTQRSDKVDKSEQLSKKGQKDKARTGLSLLEQALSAHDNDSSNEVSEIVVAGDTNTVAIPGSKRPSGVQNNALVDIDVSKLTDIEQRNQHKLAKQEALKAKKEAKKKAKQEAKLAARELGIVADRGPLIPDPYGESPLNPAQTDKTSQNPKTQITRSNHPFTDSEGDTLEVIPLEAGSMSDSAESIADTINNAIALQIRPNFAQNSLKSPTHNKSPAQPNSSPPSHTSTQITSPTGSFMLNGKQISSSVFTPIEISKSALSYALSMTSGGLTPGERLFTRIPNSIPQHLRREATEFSKIETHRQLPPSFAAVEPSQWKQLHPNGEQLSTIVASINQYYDARRDSLHELLKLVVSNLNDRAASKLSLEYSTIKRLAQGYPTLIELITNFPFQTIDYSQIIKSKNHTKSALVHLNAIFIMPEKRLKFCAQFTSCLNRITGRKAAGGGNADTASTVGDEAPYSVQFSPTFFASPLVSPTVLPKPSQSAENNVNLNTSAIFTPKLTTTLAKSSSASTTAQIPFQQPLTQAKSSSTSTTNPSSSKTQPNTPHLSPIAIKRKLVAISDDNPSDIPTKALQKKQKTTASDPSTTTTTTSTSVPADSIIDPHQLVSINDSEFEHPDDISNHQQSLNIKAGLLKAAFSVRKAPPTTRLLNGFSGLDVQEGDDSDPGKESKPWQRHRK